MVHETTKSCEHQMATSTDLALPLSGTQLFVSKFLWEMYPRLEQSADLPRPFIVKHNCQIRLLNAEVGYTASASEEYCSSLPYVVDSSHEFSVVAGYLWLLVGIFCPIKILLKS